MGKGRDKRKKHEDPEKAQKRAHRQMKKSERNAKDDDEEKKDLFNGEEDISDTIVKIQRAENKRKTVSEIELATPPTPRANALWFPIPGRDGEFVLFGGEFWDGESTVEYNDLLVYSAPKNKWRQVLSPGAPCPRSSAQGWLHKSALYVHGGEIVSRTQSQFMHFKDLWRIDLHSCAWEELSKGKGGPSARSGHRVSAYKRGGCVLFGGFFDNGQQTTFYDDLWVLSDPDGACEWHEVLQPSYAEKPHPRSGHSLAVHNDEVFVFGGYYTFRANRFQRAEATVLHDLWSINLASPTPVWQKIKLAGIPPPIRCGMASFVKDKKMYLFGGVVDLDGPGGKTLSTFHNDVFVFNLETKRFFPMMIKPKVGAKKKKEGGAIEGGGAAAAASSAGDLAAEINRVAGKKILANASESDDDEEEEEEEEEEEAPKSKALVGAASAAAASAGAPPPPEEAAAPVLISAITLKDGVTTVPCPRMNAMICVHHHFLLIYGGVFEMNGGKREVALSDVFSLNLNKMEGFTAHLVQDVSAVPWKGEGGADGVDSGSDAGSWEDGSTVAPEMMDSLMEDLDEEEEDENNNNNNNSANQGNNNNDDDDDDDAPELVAGPGNALAAKLVAAANANHHGASGGGGVDGRKSVRGKIGKGHHLEQLKQQLNSSTSIVPTPTLDETCEQFFTRSEAFWVDSAAKDLFGFSDGAAADINRKQRTRIRRTAEDMSKMQFLEATDLLRQIATVEEQLRQEKDVLREHLRSRAAAAAAAAAEDEEESDDDDDQGEDK